MTTDQISTTASAATTLRFPRHPIEGLAGTSFKHEHFAAIAAEGPHRGFFEVHAENYMGPAGRRIVFSNRSAVTIRCRSTACACRSADLSRSTEHILNVSALSSNATNQLWCLSTWHGRRIGRPSSTISCPFPTHEKAARVCEHIEDVQETIRRPILLENPSTYVTFRQSTMSETDFIRAIVRRTGCGLLLDINNVFVSATNHGFSALDYLSDFPIAAVGEIHLAGHAEQADDEDELLLIDSHDGPVADAVWKLYEIVIGRGGPIPTLIEWDSNIPDWPILRGEALAAQAIMDQHGSIALPDQSHAAA